jgi:hypothetical protein
VRQPESKRSRATQGQWRQLKAGHMAAATAIRHRRNRRMSARGTWRESAQPLETPLTDTRSDAQTSATITLVRRNHSGDGCCFANLSYLMLLHRASTGRAHILQCRYLHCPPTLRLYQRFLRRVLLGLRLSSCGPDTTPSRAKLSSRFDGSMHRLCRA